MFPWMTCFMFKAETVSDMTVHCFDHVNAEMFSVDDLFYVNAEVFPFVVTCLMFNSKVFSCMTCLMFNGEMFSCMTCLMFKAEMSPWITYLMFNGEMFP